jgi:hypothetical protein
MGKAMNLYAQDLISIQERVLVQGLKSWMEAACIASKVIQKAITKE